MPKYYPTSFTQINTRMGYLFSPDPFRDGRKKINGNGFFSFNEYAEWDVFRAGFVNELSWCGVFMVMCYGGVWKK